MPDDSLDLGTVDGAGTVVAAAVILWLLPVAGVETVKLECAVETFGALVGANKDIASVLRNSVSEVIVCFEFFFEASLAR